MQVQIVGGMSMPGSITIQSAEFISSARCGKDGLITYETKRAPKISRFMYKLSEYPLPRTLVLLVFMINSMSLTMKIVMGVMTYNLIQRIYFPDATPPPPPPVDDGFSFIPYVIQVIFYGGLLWFFNRVAPWHAAEHKVIAAYRDSGSTDLADIENANRIDRMCGGRYFFPFILGSILAGFVADALSISTFLCTLLVTEAILWVDRLVGLSNIRLTWFASRVLQTHLTTREPGLREIFTAQTAMRNLIACHEETAS